MILLPNGELSDDEDCSSDDDEDADVTYCPVDDQHESESDDHESDEEMNIPLARLPRLDFEIDGDNVDDGTVSDENGDSDNNEADNPQPGNSRDVLIRNYRWSHAKNVTTETHDFQGRDFRPLPDVIKTPDWYFKKYFDKSIFENIALQTNIYAHQQHGKVLGITASDIEIFIGMHILMSIVQMPS